MMFLCVRQVQHCFFNDKFFFFFFFYDKQCCVQEAACGEFCSHTDHPHEHAAEHT